MVWLRYSSRSAILAYLKLLTKLLDFLHNPKKVCSHNGRFYVTPEEKKISQNVSALFTRGSFLTRGWKIHSLLEVNTEYSLCRVGMATLNLHSLTLPLTLPCSPSNLQIKSWFSPQMYILGKDTPTCWHECLGNPFPVLNYVIKKPIGLRAITLWSGPTSLWLRWGDHISKSVMLSIQPWGSEPIHPLTLLPAPGGPVEVADRILG